MAKWYTKKDFLKDFIETNDIIWRNYSHKIISEHFNSWGITNKNEIIKVFIRDSFFYIASDWELKANEIENWKNEIGNVDITSIINNSVDNKIYDLIDNYRTFEDWINEKEKNDLSLYETLCKWQYAWYSELYELIKEEFIEFLENKYDELSQLEDS